MEGMAYHAKGEQTVIIVKVKNTWRRMFIGKEKDSLTFSCQRVFELRRVDLNH
jgi:hypothetical protein